MSSQIENFRNNVEITYINTVNNDDDFVIDRSLVDTDKDCSICLCKLCDNNDKLVSCPSCTNVFHRECQKTWLSHSAHKNCSMCRTVWN
jgi:hypothetical protein